MITFYRLKVNESSLRKRLKSGVGCVKLGRFEKTFTIQQEEEIANHIRKLDLMFYGITFPMFRRIVYLYAKANKISNRFGMKSGKACVGYDFAKNFLDRHKLSLRTPQSTSIARIMGFNKTQVGRFFDNLANVYQKYGFKPQQIFNVDETGVSTVPESKTKVISPKGNIFSHVLCKKKK